LQFGQTGLVLVDGWNADADRANGAGKTAIFNALAFGVYGKMPRQITTTEILRRGTTTGYVEVEIEIGEDRYRVRRERPKNLIFYKNNQLIALSQDEFETILHLDYDQFLTVIYCAQTSDMRFLLLNDTAKKEFLLTLLRLDELMACRQLSDMAGSMAQQEIDRLQKELDILQAQIATYDSLQSRAEKDIQNDLSSVMEQSERLNASLMGLSQIDRPDLARYKEKEIGLHSALRQILIARTLRPQKMQEFNAISEELNAIINRALPVCPSCGVLLHVEDSVVVKVDEKLLKYEIANKKQQLEKQRCVIKNELDQIDECLLKESSISHVLGQLQEKQIEASAQYDRAQRDLIEQRGLQRSLEQRRAQYDAELAALVGIQQKKGQLTSASLEISARQQVMKQRQQIFKDISNIYSSTGAMAYILDSIIESFNELVAEYVGILWPNASYRLNSSRENVDGQIVAKFSNALIINGKTATIGSLSGGELRALSLAVDFALIETLSRYFSISVNPLILDEAFNGLDSVGRELITTILEKMSATRQIWVIDHVTEAKTTFKQIVRVEKHNSISSISSDVI